MALPGPGLRVSERLPLLSTVDFALLAAARIIAVKARTSWLDPPGALFANWRWFATLGALGWWANSRLRQEDTPPSGQLRLFTVVVPVIKAVERTVSMPFGISLLTVGQRL